MSNKSWSEMTTEEWEAEKKRIRKLSKMKKEDIFISTPEYDEEMGRDERLIEKKRKERELEAIKEGETI